MTEAIEQMLAVKSGLDLEAIGKESLRRALAVRMASCNLSEPAAYLQFLGSSRTELENLIDELTVPETWFFRDRAPFELLEQFARERQNVRVLSAPCATGEEAYSIAITLLEAGLPADRFHVDACDISPRLLEVAARAVYTAVSFREDWCDHRNRWFHPVPGGFALQPDIAALVRFHRDDLLKPVFLSAQPPYDAVFCRNLLIYLRPGARQILIDRIGGLLRPDGIVFVGHAEVPALLQHGYATVSFPGCFACHKLDLEHADQKKREPARPTIVRTADQRADMPVATTGVDRDRLFQRARELADQAALDDAWSLCEELLGANPEADIYYLEGLISATRDRLTVAEECFRRALYLDPSHYEALVQMSLVCERRGEPIRASMLRSRAARAARRTKTDEQ